MLLLLLMLTDRLCIGNMSRVNAREQVAEPGPPPPPLNGWKLVSEDTFKDVALHIPLVTSGKLLYLTYVCYILSQVM